MNQKADEETERQERRKEEWKNPGADRLYLYRFFFFFHGHNFGLVRVMKVKRHYKFQL